MKKIFIILFFCAFLQPAVKAQSVEYSNLTWAVTGFHNNGNNEDVTLASRFETSPQLIKWVQKSGSMVYDFTVTGKTGSWTDLNADGEITFHVTLRDKSGTIRFARQQGRITIEPNILKEGRNMLPYVFTVSTITTR
jgi:hypothetical protein